MVMMRDADQKKHTKLAKHLEDEFLIYLDAFPQLGPRMVEFGKFKGHVAIAGLAFLWNQDPLVEVQKIGGGGLGAFTKKSSSVQVDEDVVNKYEDYIRLLESIPAKDTKEIDKTKKNAIAAGTLVKTKWPDPAIAYSPLLDVVLLSLLVAWGQDHYGSGAVSSRIRDFQQLMWDASVNAPVFVR
jgi:hypothetical protein